MFDTDPEKASPTEKFLGMSARILVWGIFAVLLFLLRSFFLLIFLTFVFSYILSRAEGRLSRKIHNRVLRVIITAFCFLTLIILVGGLIIPRMKEQTIIFVDRLPEYVKTLDGHLLALSDSYPILKNVMPAPTPPTAETAPLDAHQSLTIQFLKNALGDESSNSSSMASTFEAARKAGAYLLTVLSAFLLALLFSFLIVLDLPQLKSGTKSLQNTKLGFIYDEVADSIIDFGRVLGRALEAQLFIAILNTIFTAIGLLLIGLTDNITFISVIVFFCSFIPVAGVFISSVPIGLLALQQGGLSLLFVAIGMITIVHMIEAYILNPKIYGFHMRMNPVVVLIILTVAGKMFHFWGLILGVPVVNYLFGHAIRLKRPHFTITPDEA